MGAVAGAVEGLGRWGWGWDWVRGPGLPGVGCGFGVRGLWGGEVGLQGPRPVVARRASAAPRQPQRRAAARPLLLRPPSSPVLQVEFVLGGLGAPVRPHPDEVPGVDHRRRQRVRLPLPRRPVVRAEGLDRARPAELVAVGRVVAARVAAVAHRARKVVVALVAPFAGVVEVEVVAELVEVGDRFLGGLLGVARGFRVASSRSGGRVVFWGQGVSDRCILLVLGKGRSPVFWVRADPPKVSPPVKHPGPPKVKPPGQTPRSNLPPHVPKVPLDPGAAVAARGAAHVAHAAPRAGLAAGHYVDLEGVVVQVDLGRVGAEPRVGDVGPLCARGEGEGARAGQRSAARRAGWGELPVCLGQRGAACARLCGGGMGCGVEERRPAGG